MSRLNRGQFTQLNLACAIALRTSLFIEALLGLYRRHDASDQDELRAARRQIDDYRRLVSELADRFDLTGDPHDLRPIVLDQVSRLRDALNLQLVDEMSHYGPLDPDDERALRQQLATLALMVDPIAQCLHHLPPLET